MGAKSAITSWLAETRRWLLEERMQQADELCGCDTILGQLSSTGRYSFSLTLFSCYSQESAGRRTEAVGLPVLFVPEVHTNKTHGGWGILFRVSGGVVPSVGSPLWCENLSQCGLYFCVSRVMIVPGYPPLASPFV